MSAKVRGDSSMVISRLSRTVSSSLDGLGVFSIRVLRVGNSLVEFSVHSGEGNCSKTR